MKPHFYGLALLLVALMLQPVRGQQPAPPPKPAAEKPPSAAPPAPPSEPSSRAPIKLNVVVSRYQNDKKLSSLTYSLSVSDLRASLRMISQVPFPSSTVSEGKPVPGYSYRDVGISIDARVSFYEPGVYRVELTVTDSSISTGSQLQGAPAVAGVPVIKSFSIANSTAILKDGQTTQLTSAADPISGETMRVDVSLSLAK